MSSPTTTSAARASNGLRRGKARSIGHGCHVGHSPPTRFVYSFMRWPTILGNFLRTLATPEPIKEWSLTSLKEKLIKIGAKIVSHGRYVAFQMAEVGAPRRREEEIGKCRITSEQPCCTRDEGRPLGLGLQDQGPNRHKPLQNNGWGGER